MREFVVVVRRAYPEDTWFTITVDGWGMCVEHGGVLSLLDTNNRPMRGWAAGQWQSWVAK